MKNRWKISGLTIVHRTGRLCPGDMAVFILVSAEHRRGIAFVPVYCLNESIVASRIRSAVFPFFAVLALALQLKAAGLPDKSSAAAVAQRGSTVTFHYTLTVEGRTYDTSRGKSPLVVIHGAGQIIPGLEEKMTGMKKGDKNRIVVSPDKGYGPVNPDAFQSVPRKSFKNKKALKMGGIVTGEHEGRPIRATVIGMSKKEVILDLNHPLAGKTLQFDVEILNVTP